MRVQGELETALGYQFVKPRPAAARLTHRSLANERGPDRGEEEHGLGDNERLEFLGDAVLGLVVAEAMFLLHPDWREGELTRVRAQLVSRQHMGEVAAALRTGPSYPSQQR